MGWLCRPGASLRCAAMAHAPHPPPRIPRAQWSSHRNWPGQVLLLGSHENFRRISRQLIDAAEGDVDPGEIGLYFGMWISAMRSHEGYEEHKLYPYLERKHGASLQHLRDGHEALHEAERAVRDALQGEGDLRRALEAHDAILVEHLEAEENAVIPPLLDMEPREFARYVSQPIERLLD